MERLIPSYIVIKLSRFRKVTLFEVELPPPTSTEYTTQKTSSIKPTVHGIQLRHTSLITRSLKEIHSGHGIGLIDTGPVTRL